MNVRSFIDTNVLVYTDDASAPTKKRDALDLLAAAHASRKGVVSTQVLAEYYWVATRKLGVPEETGRQKAGHFAKLDTVVLEVDDILSAIDLSRMHHLAIWDALIVQAARRSACQVLYSEDLQDGRNFDGLRVVNPFRK
jgi:predicted nucleic acid-binding protein